MTEAEIYYQRALIRVERKMGNRGTSDRELDTHVRAFLKKPALWRGVFALNEPWRNIGGCRIVNLEPRGQRGEHWVALADNLVYDSFGRTKVLELREHKLGPVPSSDLTYTEDDAEQTKREDNCGQRCIAWLMTYEKYGPVGAREI